MCVLINANETVHGDPPRRARNTQFQPVSRSFRPGQRNFVAHRPREEGGGRQGAGRDGPPKDSRFSWPRVIFMQIFFMYFDRDPFPARNYRRHFNVYWFSGGRRYPRFPFLRNKGDSLLFVQFVNEGLPATRPPGNISSDIVCLMFSFADVCFFFVFWNRAFCHCETWRPLFVGFGKNGPELVDSWE